MSTSNNDNALESKLPIDASVKEEVEDVVEVSEEAEEGGEPDAENKGKEGASNKVKTKFESFETRARVSAASVPYLHVYAMCRCMRME